VTTTEIIRLNQVTFTYEGDIVALKNLNLIARKGEFVVVLGANGAGKSTLCYLLSGIVPNIYGGKRLGDMSVAGSDPWDEPLYLISQRCGVVMQDPEVQLFMPTVRSELAFGPANLAIPRQEILRRSQEALKLVRMEGYEEHNPRDLSGGQKQRIALASILTMLPQVLVLDEPTSQLDPVGRWEVGESIQRLKQSGDLTIVMTTHETEEILHLADQVLVLDHGETVLQGSPAEVFSQTEKLEQAGVKTPALILCQAHYFPASKIRSKISLTVRDVADQISQAVKIGQIQVSPEALPSDHKTQGEPEVILEARKLTIRYPGPPPVIALKNINLQIRKGEMVGIIGQNGSGKSTLVKCFVNLLRPQQGEVLVEGQKISGYTVGGMARRVGLVLQNPDYQLFTVSCQEEIRFGLENLGVPPAEMDARVQEALELIGLSEQADLFPFRLSFGDRRKLAVAATLALNPKVLIMDEPTTAQDYLGRYQLAELAKRFHDERGGTVLIITHDVDLIARYAERLIVLHEGEILLDGPLAEVFTQSELLKKSFVVPPVATQLAELLTPLGVPSNVMTLNEMYQVLKPAA
jgi:energy-coupling factor transport system ATP-binding protein